MNTDTGELGTYGELVQQALDPANVAPVPKELQPDLQEHLQRRGRFVNLRGGSRLAQLARDHQRRKKQVTAKARSHRKQVKRDKSRLRKSK